MSFITGTATPSDATCTPCKKGKFYCGTQLRKMGYTNTRVYVLYECDSNSNARVFVDCVAGGCVENGDEGGFCSIDLMRGKVCGWLLRFFNFPVANRDDRTIYQRQNRTTATMAETCPIKCYNAWGSWHVSQGHTDVYDDASCGNAADMSGCTTGTQHCGSDLYSITMKVDWKINNLYDCTDGVYLNAKENKACRDGCVNGACQNNSISAKPASGCGASKHSY